ncbi:MAG TPA: hypothetical protein VK973_10545 [Arenicellales bacterium]|nr:hypothetical protein [Arenicellales bacterium]
MDKYTDAIAFSRNFAESKPDIGRTEREHIIGLAKVLEQAQSELAAERERAEAWADILEDIGFDGKSTVEDVQARVAYWRQCEDDALVADASAPRWRRCG